MFNKLRVFNMKLSPYLHVFNIVISQGEKRQNVFHFDELTAWHDFDGYTCYLGYKDLTMSLAFHSKFSYQFEHKKTMAEFDALIQYTAINSTTKYNKNLATGDEDNE